MSQVKKHTTEKSVTHKLESYAQARKVLKELTQSGYISNFKRFYGQNKNALEYRVSYRENRFFYLRFFFASYHPLRGAEYKNEGWQLSIFLDKSERPKIKVLKSILKHDIEERNKGIEIEDEFEVEVLKLIKNDKEVSSVITNVIKTNYYEDVIQKFDRFLKLTNGLELPVQIKSSEFGEAKYKRENPNAPVIYYSSLLLKKSGLKNFLLKLCRPYLLKVL